MIQLEMSLMAGLILSGAIVSLSQMGTRQARSIAIDLADDDDC